MLSQKELVREVRFTATIGDHEIDGVVINPGAWFGKVWLFQIWIANALAPYYAIEADSEQDAIDDCLNRCLNILPDALGGRMEAAMLKLHTKA